jgi:drug/metabolite transporter (DMT)-like permease
MQLYNFYMRVYAKRLPSVLLVCYNEGYTSVGGKRMKQTTSGRIELFIAAILWGTSFFMMKNTVESVPPALLLAIRFAIGAVALTLISGKKLLSVTAKQVAKIAFIALFLSAACIVQTMGLVDTTPGKNAFLTSIYCILVPFLLWIVVRKRPKAKSFVAATVCLIGIALVSLDGDLSIRYGDKMTLLSGLLFAGQIVAVELMTGDIDPLPLSALQFSFAAVYCYTAHRVMEPSVALMQVPREVLIGLVFLGLFPTACSYTFQIIGQKKVSANTAALILSLESVFGVLASVLFFGEVLTARLVLGFAVIFLGVVISETDILRFLR